MDSHRLQAAMGMTTLEILSQATRDDKLRDVFRGCFAINQLPLLIFHKPSALVVNLDSADEAGSHWVAIYISTEGKVTYFDSFGRAPSDDRMLTFLFRQTRGNPSGFSYNSTRIQAITSSKCGYHCLRFLRKAVSDDLY